MTVWRGLFNDYFLYREASLRIQSLTAGNALIATRFATVAPRGEIQTFGEHGLLCAESGRLVANR